LTLWRIATAQTRHKLYIDIDLTAETTAMNADTEDFFSKGVDALQHQHFFLAQACFEQAAKDGMTPALSSYLAYCRAKTKGEFREAIAIARDALAREPESGVHYLNLGRIHLLAGDRQQALDTFRQGVRFDLSGDILLELERLGVRKPPVFPSLRRGHPLNRICGTILSRLGLR
jgi:tetratricopeptide (TPR) repeat protein